MEGIELGSPQDDFFCYLTIAIVHACKLNFSKRTEFPKYYMVGWVKDEPVDEIEDRIIVCDLFAYSLSKHE